MSRRKVGDDWGSHGSGGIQAFEDELDSMVLDVKPRVKKANKPPTVNNSRQGCNSRGGSNRGGGQKRPPSGQQRSVASGRQGFRNEERFDNSAIEFLRRPESPRNAASEGVGRRRLGHKVMLQTLNMTEDNQEMVLNTLKHVQDEDFSLPEENEYSNVNLQTERRFWLRDATLKVVEQSHSENDKLSPSNMYSNFALNKLLRYGFHKDRCKSALEQNEGDVGRSLEQLWCSCFNVTFERDDSFSEDDILERRSEEVLALSSIYGDAFVERIPNRVWVVCLDLPVLETLINKKPAADHRKKPAADHQKKTADSRLACRLYKKGTCRFEHKCRYRHEAAAKHVYAALALENPDPDGAASKYELEIRFPDECSYPFEPPLVAFSTTHDYFPKSKCLNVTSRLYEEARGVAADHLPAVFSLMGILMEDEDALKRAIESPSLPHYFSAGDWPTDAAPRHDNAPTLV
ncbi:PREDICTED: putative ATP-dependent RNA helicase DHX57, partial [Priapulus caudatus]|uniref:ATP-dependent RNA helicase DHX57 n=1 Tax=Priapulus caudatus TaxID=37621 RepID=A0ABM1EVH6_PRICU